MHLRAPKARLSALGCCSVTNQLVRAMTYRMYRAFIASLSLVTLMLAANETSARSGAALRGGFASTHSIAHRPVAQLLRHHRRNNAEALWPATGDSYGPSNGGPIGGDVTQPASGDVHYTYDIPWDWAHRYPPAVTPSERPYVPSCAAEAVKVPGRDGGEQTVSITRCY
jgi:hypothetical protein